MLLLYVLKKICCQFPEDGAITALKHTGAMCKDCFISISLFSSKWLHSNIGLVNKNDPMYRR